MDEELQERKCILKAFEEKCKKDPPQWRVLKDELNGLAQKLAGVIPSKRAFSEYARLLSAINEAMNAMAGWSFAEYDVASDVFMKDVKETSESPQQN